MDPSSSAQSPGWPLLNILAYLYSYYPEIQSHRILCWRDTIHPGSAPWRSRFGTFQVGTKCEPGKRPTAVGWERTPQNKLAPRIADLGTTMDPLQLADQALSLNLKLMRWRILPALDLEKVANTKCLLLGAGTLGCYVARTLMAWGIRKITFVDSSKVSFSNPVRQPLFEFEDCLEGGKPKAECAANRLKRIFPGVVSARPSRPEIRQILTVYRMPPGSTFQFPCLVIPYLRSSLSRLKRMWSCWSGSLTSMMSCFS